MLFTNEVKNMEELADILENFESDYTVKVAVVCFLFDKDGKLILQRRGAGARDEVGKLEAIGGSVNSDDGDFREALKREMVEEAGSEFSFTLDNFMAAQSDIKFDKNSDEYVNWIILAYKGTMTGGKLINGEPERCVGFESNYLDDFKKEDLSKTAINYIRFLKEHK